MNRAHPVIAAIRFEGVTLPALWIALALLGAGFLVWTYRGIFRQSGRRLVGTLLLLRAAGILALVLALAKPTWTRETELVDPGRLAIVLDNSASMSLPVAGGQSRYQRAKLAIDRLRGAIAAGRPGPRLEVDLFDITGKPLTGPIPETPIVGRTDLTAALTEAIARLRSRPLAGVALVSDGMDNTGRADLRAMADAPVPIHAIGFRTDPTAGGLDLAVRQVRAPERAMVHNAIKVDVTVAKVGGAATRASVVIKRGRETFATQPVELAGGDAEQVVSVEMTPSQAGTFVFSAAVAAETGERRTANNTAYFPLRVDTEAIRVLYLEGFLRYEYKFLKNRLEDDPDVSLVAVVRRANPERTNDQARGDLITPERLKRFDVVILGDMEAGDWDASEYRALLAWLDEKGHALLLLGGYHSFGPDGLRASPLAEALPVVFAAPGQPAQSEEPFVLRLTDEGRRHPAFELSGDRVQDAASWSTAPPLSGASLVRRAKPGAVVLAVDPNVIIEGQPAVVAASQRFGAGHTMVLAIDTTWRWSRLTRVAGRSDTLYARFWSQTIRWLAGRQPDADRPPLVASTDRPGYDIGQPVTVRVVRQPRPDADLSATAVGVEVTGAAGRSVSLPMRANSAEPDVFTGAYYPSDAGRYEVAASLASGGRPIANQATEFLVHGPDLETADPGTNRPLLQALAATTGGLYFDVEEAVKLAEKLPRTERRLRRVQRTEFWNSPALFLGFLGAVSAEWFLRRRNHLV